MALSRANRQVAVRERLQEICRANRGRLTAAKVVADARDKRSPLHPLFDWNNASAAHKHRIEVARDLISNVRVVVTTRTRTLRAVAYVRDPRAANDEQGYVETVRVREDRDLAREVLIEEFGRASAALQRAYALASAVDLENEVEVLITRVDRVLRRIPTEPVKAD